MFRNTQVLFSKDCKRNTLGPDILSYVTECWNTQVSLRCLSFFNLRLLITSVVSSNFSLKNPTLQVAI